MEINSGQIRVAMEAEIRKRLKGSNLPIITEAFVEVAKDAFDAAVAKCESTLEEESK